MAERGHHPDRPWAARRQALLGVVAAAALAVACWRVGPPTGDFANYYVAAALWVEGADLSRLYDYRWFTDHAARLGFGDRLVGFPVLTPPSALFAAPLLPLGPELAGQAWRLLQALLAVVLGLVSARAARLPGWAGCLALGLAWPALRSHLEQGQFHLPAVLLVALGLWAWDRERPAAAGAAWGLATGLKVLAWPLLLLAACLRSRRAVLAGGAVLLVGGIGSVLLVGWPLHRTWLGEIAGPSSAGFFVDPWTVGFQSLGAAARRAWLPHAGLGDPGAAFHPELAVGLPAAVALALPLLTAAAGTAWPHLSPGARSRLLGAASVAALVGGPVLARYGLLLVVPPVLFALGATWRGGERARALALGLAALALVRVPTPPAWPELTAFLGVPRFWLALALWGLLLPWRGWTRSRGLATGLALGLALLVGWRASPPATGQDGARPAEDPALPLVAADPVLGPDGALYFSGLSGDRGGLAGRGWMGFRWQPEAGPPERVAGGPGAHWWSPRVQGSEVQWVQGADGAPWRPGSCGGALLVEAEGDIFLGQRRLTSHPGRDRYPVCDPARGRVWFLSDRGVGVHALRPWWVPL